MRAALLLVSLVFAVSALENPTDCGSLGFTDDLLCSTCDKIDQIVKDTPLSEECRRCCKTSYQVVKAASAVMEVCQRCMKSFPEVQGFLSKHADKYHRLTTRDAPGAPPELILKDEQGRVIERVSITEWSIDNINEFLTAKLLQ